MSSQTVKIEVTNVENVVVTSNGQEYMLVPKKDEIMEVDFEMPEYVKATTGEIVKVKQWIGNNPVIANLHDNYVSLAEWQPATALEYYTQEARARGFKKGVKFKSAASGNVFQCGSDKFKLCDESGSFYSGIGNGCIYDLETDTWAEIIPDEVEFIPGKLYMSSYGTIVMCKSVREHEFSGMVLKSDGRHQIGQYRRDWHKPSFHPYTGTITL